MTATEARTAPTDDGATTSRRGVARLLIILGSLSAVTPLTIDLYLPAMPQMADALTTGPSQVQLTLTAFFVGTAIGQLVSGPLGDTYGRRRPLLIGLVAYVLVSLACAFAPSIWALVGLRVVQALGAATALVLARAIVRDLWSGPRLARTFSTLMLVSGLAPILAPAIGAQLMRFTDWRGIFLSFSVFGLALIVAAAIGLPETLPVERRRPASIGGALRTYRALLGDRVFVGYALACGLACAVIFGYIGGSSFVLQEQFGLTPQQFSLVFGGNAIGIVLVAQVNGRLLGRVSARRLLTAGLVASAAGAVGVLAAALAGLGLAFVLPPLFVAIAFVGMVMPNGAALALADHPNAAGTASALLGTVQFGVGGLAAPLTGVAGDASAISMGVVMACCGCLALVVFLVLTRPRGAAGPDRADAGESAAPPA